MLFLSLALPVPLPLPLILRFSLFFFSPGRPVVYVTRRIVTTIFLFNDDSRERQRERERERGSKSHLSSTAYFFFSRVYIHSSNDERVKKRGDLLYPSFKDRAPFSWNEEDQRTFAPWPFTFDVSSRPRTNVAREKVRGALIKFRGFESYARIGSRIYVYVCASIFHRPTG